MSNFTYTQKRDREQAGYKVLFFECIQLEKN